MFMGSVPFVGKLQRLSEVGKSIKLIKHALAYGNKSVTLKHFQKQVVQSLGVGWVGTRGGFWYGCASQYFETNTNHIHGL